MRKTLLWAAILCLVGTGSTAAQQAVGGTFYGGIPVPMGTTGDYLGSSFSWGGGVRYAPPEKPFAIRFDIRNSRFNIHDEFFNDPQRLVVDDGFARTWDFVLSGEIGMRNDKPFRLYGIAGVGYYNRYVALTDAELVSGCYWDPWWGYICGTGTADLIVADQSKWDFGFNFGAGLSFKVQGGVTLFVEAVYNTVNFSSGDTNQAGNPATATTWMPIVFGIKF
jgi:hypothetical protein